MDLDGAPVMAQCWNAGNDVNGNPRRVWLGYDKLGHIVRATDEGLAGTPDWCRDWSNVPHIPMVRCGVKQYRDWLGLDCADGRGR